MSGDGDQAKQDKAVATIVSWLKMLLEPGQVTELRSLEVSTRAFRRSHTVSGYFDYDHINDLARKALELTQYAKGVYFTLNPLDPALLSRRCNRADVADRGVQSTDLDVLKRRWLLIDCDPIRKAGISATDAEKAQARVVADQVFQYLRSVGWPDPILSDSGNGYHLLYRIDLPADDGGLVKRVLHALADRFNTPAVEIDTAVFNPARICKFYGTFSRKGDSTQDRPHRLSKVIAGPDADSNGQRVVLVVSQELLDAVAGPRAEPALPVPSNLQSSGNASDIRERARHYLAKLPPAVSGQHGHDSCFRAACVLVQGFGFNAEDAMPLLEEWNATCQPPWSTKELEHKLADAAKQPGTRGALLSESSKRPNSDIPTRSAPAPKAPTEDTSSKPILELLGAQVLGEYENGTVQLFSEHCRKIVTLGRKDLDRLSRVGAIQCFGEPAAEYLYEGKEPVMGKFRVQDLREAVAMAACMKPLTAGSVLGIGCWDVGNNQIALVGNGEAAVLHPGGKLERTFTPCVNGRVLDFGSPVAWYDYDEISNYLTNAKDRDWCIGVMDEATKLFGQWYWKHEMSDMLATSLVACTWVQTVWPWRPLVVVTGPSNSGKTMFFGDALRRIFGKLGAHVEKPTEAGIRQYVRNDAIALLVDEFEHDQHRQKVLELFRASSRGGEVIRGTSDQKGRRFGLRLLPWMAAVETGLKREADRNRYIIFETERPDGRGNGLNLPPEESLANLGMRILAVALTHVFPAVELADWLKRQKFDGVPSRVIESFSVPVAMLASLSCAVGLKDSRISRGILKTGVRIFTTKCGRD